MSKPKIIHKPEKKKKTQKQILTEKYEKLIRENIKEHRAKGEPVVKNPLKK